jgi:hypothetical protein
VPDIAKVSDLTGYAPRIKLEEALILTRDYFVQSNRLAATAEVRRTPSDWQSALGVRAVPSH